MIEEDETPVKRGRGRAKGFIMSQEHRLKIANSNILNVLLQHVKGEREMSATQVTAGLGLLKKVFPDLQSIELSGDPESPVEVVSRIELVAPSDGNDSTD